MAGVGLVRIMELLEGFGVNEMPSSAVLPKMLIIDFLTIVGRASTVIYIEPFQCSKRESAQVSSTSV